MVRPGAGCCRQLTVALVDDHVTVAAADDGFRVASWTGVLLGHEKNQPLRICWNGLASGNELKDGHLVHAAGCEVAQVVGGHAARAVVERDGSDGQAVQGGP